MSFPWFLKLKHLLKMGIQTNTDNTSKYLILLETPSHSSSMNIQSEL